MHAKHTLYQLSYIPFNTFICMRTMRFELIPSAWKADNLPLIYIRKRGVEPLILYITYKYYFNVIFVHMFCFS
jgi:hypothetical protein